MNREFKILNPCAKRWDELPGTGRARYCDACQISVHDVHRYSPDEWDQLRRESNGKVCGYLAGAVTTVRPSRRTWLVGTLLAAVSPLMAQSGRVRIHVTDASGAVVPSAEASRLGADDKPVDEMHANESGEIVWTGLPVGPCRFAVRAPGFSPYYTWVIISNSSDEIQVYAQLGVGFTGEVVQIKKRKHWWVFW